MAAIIQTVKMDRSTQVFNFPVLIGVMALLLWMLLTDRRVTRREGITLLAVYATYIAALIIMTVVIARAN